MGKPLNSTLIKQLRKSTGQRQVDLAALCGISEESVRLAERGKPIGLDVLTRLATGLRVEPADQLLAEKGLTLERVRRVGQKEATQGQEGQPKARPAAEGIARVMLDLQSRRELRRYVLEAVTPESGLNLPRSGTCFHGDGAKRWPRSAFEGFLSACLFYLKNSIRPAKGEWGGDQHAVVNSTLMGKHAQRVWGTCDEDEELPSSVSDHELCEKMWNDSDLLASGSYSELMHRYCPACEANSFYYGWRELCLWLTSTAVEGGMRAESVNRSIPTVYFMEPVLQMVVAYLTRYEGNETYGQESFWGMAGFFLKHQYGEPHHAFEEESFSKYHDYPISEFWDSIRQELEFNDEAKERFGKIVAAYPDRDTGIAVAVLTLQTEFICTGKPRGEFVAVKAARHP